MIGGRCYTWGVEGFDLRTVIGKIDWSVVLCSTGIKLRGQWRRPLTGSCGITYHVVVKVGVHVPPLSSSHQEPDQGDDGCQTDNTTNDATGDSPSVLNESAVCSIAIRTVFLLQHSLELPPLLAPPVVIAPIPEDVTTEPSELVMVV